MLFLSTALYLPYIHNSRDNRVLLIGILCLFVVVGMLWKYTKLGTMLLGWITLRFYFGASEWIGTPLYTILCLSLLCYAGLRAYPIWKEKKHLIYDTICLVALLNVVFQVMQFNGIQWPLKFQYDMSLFKLGACGLMGNPNEISCLLAMSLPMFFRPKWSYWIVIIILGLVLAQSLVGFLAASVVVILWFVSRLRLDNFPDTSRGVIVSICVVILLVLYAVKIDRLDIPEQIRHRGMVYQTTIKVAQIKWYGWGFGQYQYVMPLFTFSGNSPKSYTDFLLANVNDYEGLAKGIEKVTGTKDIDKAREYFRIHKTPAPFAQAHNEYLELFFSTGIVGIILFAFFVLSILIKGFKNTDKLPVMCFISSLITACFFFPWQIISTAVLTMSFVVIILGEARCEKP